MKLGVVLLAAGSGTRFGSDKPKQFIPLNGKEIWQYAFEAFNKHADVDEMVVVFPKGELTASTGWHRDFIEGGDSRRESSLEGVRHLMHIDPEITHVLIHDAVRPFIDRSIIDRCVDALEAGYDAVDVTIPSADSIAKVSENGMFVESIPNRSVLRLGQTPQGFKIERLLNALQSVPKGSHTDDIGIFLEHYPYAKVKNVDGDEDNMKITTQSDLIKAERIANKYMNFNVNSISGKKALVLGASGGIGNAVCDELGSRGVSALYRPSARGKTEMEILDEITDVDIVIDCIGQLTDMKFIDENLDWNEWLYEFRLNFMMKTQMLIAMIQKKKLSKNASIVFVGSSSAHHGRPNYSAYCSAKSALMNFVQSVGSEQNDYRINIVNPGRTDTKLREKIFQSEDKTKLCSPECVARVIVDVSSMNCSGSVFDVRANNICV